jgi:poly-gamma-glutamate synthesis protein (capsule biosynthesis protein)
VFYLDLEGDPSAAPALAASSRSAREAGARFVILSLHWGPNMVETPPKSFRRLAHRAVEFADLIHGHSAHVFQGPEVRHNRLILYDTGDFLDDYAVDPDLRNDWSFLFLVDLSPAGAVERLRLVPVRLDFAVVNLAAGEERRAICDRMVERARSLGTRLTPTSSGLRSNCGHPEGPGRPPSSLPRSLDRRGRDRKCGGLVMRPEGERVATGWGHLVQRGSGRPGAA